MATQRARQQRHFKGWWGAFQGGWIAHWQILQQGPPSYFSIAGNTQDSVLWFRFATHVGHFERSGANGRNRRSCILARAVYHSPVYCTGILQTLRAAVYYGANHWYITTVYCISYTDMSCISCQPTARNRLNKTFWCQHHGLDSRLLISKKCNFQKPPKLFTVMIID